MERTSCGSIGINPDASLDFLGEFSNNDEPEFGVTRPSEAHAALEKQVDGAMRIAYRGVVCSGCRWLLSVYRIKHHESMSAANKKALVIVESPAKAKTIAKYLGKGYKVEASIGHIRDLPGGRKDLPEKFKKEPWALSLRKR